VTTLFAYNSKENFTKINRHNLKKINGFRYHKPFQKGQQDIPDDKTTKSVADIIYKLQIPKDKLANKFTQN
jgi:hypothetical protein